MPIPNPEQDPLYLRNAWYVAAWDHEVGRALTPVTMGGPERAPQTPPITKRTGGGSGDAFALEETTWGLSERSATTFHIDVPRRCQQA